MDGRHVIWFVGDRTCQPDIIRQVPRDNSLAITSLYREVFFLNTFGLAITCNKEDFTLTRKDFHSNNFILVVQLRTAHARRDETHWPHLIFLEADRHALRGGEQNILTLAVG